MKKTKIFLAATFFILTISQGLSQEYEIKEKAIIGVLETPDKTKSEIFSSINKWISLHYNSAKNVVQLNDKEAGNIIVKGINGVAYKNIWKEVYPNNKHMQDYSTLKFNHTIEINIKDDKFRIIYNLTDIVPENQMTNYEHINDMVFDLIDLVGLKEDPVMTYNSYLEGMMKKGLIGKKKREKILEMTKPSFEQVNKDIIGSIKATMLDIKKTVISSKNEDW